MTSEITVHLISGEEESFRFSEASDTDPMLESFQTRDPFGVDHLTFSGDDGISVFRGDAITHIEISLDRHPEWIMLPGFLGIFQDSGEDPATEHPESASESLRDDEFARCAVTLEMEGGWTLGLQLEVSAQAWVDRRRVYTSLVHGTPIPVRRHGGGLTLINPARVLALHAVPGLDEPEAQVWRAERVTEDGES